MIDRATVDRILDAANIVDVVSEFVNLRKAGVNYKGLCPFHDDKTPSFMVSPAKNICHCFACGKGGTPVGFIMEHEQMTYPEALRWLARKYNIEIRERELTNEERQKESDRESMFIVNEWAAKYFQNILKNDVDGRAIGMQYFRSRGIRDDIIEKFQLGYALPSRTALSTAATKAGYKEEYLVRTGLCYKREESGGLVDRYAGRVIFPWLSTSGKVVAFGGRLLDSRTKGVQQKYVNSPDSEIYHKEQQLYGIFQAKRQIAKEDRVYMVEGYTDVIAMHQCGIENVVANSGTALSVYQIKQLHRFTDNITLLYDGDEAGIHAALRGTDMLLAEGMNIKVLILPDGDDPDSFARKHTAAEFRKYIDEHQTDFIQFKSDVMLRGVSDPIKRSEAINSIVRSISVITDPIVRDTYITDCSHRLGINEATLIAQMNKFIRQDIEQRYKDARREEERAARLNNNGNVNGDTNPNVNDNPNVNTNDNVNAQPPTPNTKLLTPNSKPLTPNISTMIVELLVRHGGDVIFNNVETDDGQTIERLTVAQYIYYSLNADGLSLGHALYDQMLAEAAAQSEADTSFNAEQYFAHHDNFEIVQMAASMAFDHFQLRKSQQKDPTPEQIREQATRLLMDFRLDYADAQLKQLKAQISQAVSNPQLMMQLMEQYKDVQNIRNSLARKLGTSIVV